MRPGASEPRLAVVLLATIALVACSATGVFASSDPATKLRQAQELYVKQDRPVPAERLIREALEIYQKNDDQLGVAEAYRIYGFFYRSAAVERWEKVYRWAGFLDKTVTFDRRFEKSAEYFEKSASIFEQAGALDRAVNAELNGGMSYGRAIPGSSCTYLAGQCVPTMVGCPENDASACAADATSACKAYDRSLVMYRRAQGANPDKQPELPTGVKSFEELVVEFKTALRCPP